MTLLQPSTNADWKDSKGASFAMQQKQRAGSSKSGESKSSAPLGRSPVRGELCAGSLAFGQHHKTLDLNACSFRSSVRQLGGDQMLIELAELTFAKSSGICPNDLVQNATGQRLVGRAFRESINSRRLAVAGRDFASEFTTIHTRRLG